MNQTEFTLNTILPFLKSYPGCLFLKDINGRYIYTSDLCQHVDQWETGGIIGKNDLEAQKNKELGKQYYEEDLQILREGGSHKCYSEIKTESGSLYYEINRSAVQDDKGNIIGIIGTVVDATREFQLQQQVRKQFITDVVTGVYNNRYLELWLEKEQPVYPFSLIACDCNFLKRINDTFGHECGDELLKNAGELFLENLPEKCVPVRVGGDEFLILCNDTPEEEAKRLIDILTEKAGDKRIGGIMLSIAYGSCTIQKDEMTFDECRRCADKRMYAFKRMMKEDYFKGAGQADPIYNEELFRNLMSQMPVVCFFKDTDCRYRYINSYDEKVLKNKEETHFGIGLTDIELQKDEVLGREYYEDDLRILATGTGSILMKEILVDDSIKYYQIIKSAVRDEENKIIGIIGTVTDVTATKLALG